MPRSYESTSKAIQTLSLSGSALDRINPINATKRLPARAIARIKSSPRLVMHVAVMVLVTSVVALGGISAVRSEQTKPGVASTASNLAQDTGFGGNSIVDSAASAFIAADVAIQLDLPVVDELTQHAESLGSQITNVTGGSQYVAKPQVVVATAAANKALKNYTVLEGDTVSGVAQKHGISSETLAWANGISVSARLLPNTNLIILPVNGVLHTVRAGDNAEALAQTYQSNAAQIIAFNDLEVSGMQPGAQIVIPDGVKPQVAGASTGFSVASVPQYSGNGYDYGYCTWYAKNKRPDLPSNLGNAVSWYWNAARSGFKVGGSPAPGAVAWEPTGGLGHVAVVEEVNGDQVRVSEMNMAGWGVVSTRWESASHFRYIY